MGGDLARVWRINSLPESRIQRCNHGFVAERLEQALDGTLFDESLTQVLVPSCGDEDNRHRLSAPCQFLLQLGSGHTGHGDIKHQACGLRNTIGREKIFRRRKRPRFVTQFFQQIRQRRRNSSASTPRPATRSHHAVLGHHNLHFALRFSATSASNLTCTAIRQTPIAP